MRILVTGANRGIGLELVRAWIDAGHEVWGSARSAMPGALRALEPAGILEIDLLDEAGVVNGMTALSDAIDGLDLLVNCAGVDARAFGVPDEQRGPFDAPADSFTEVIRVNVLGPMIVTREALPLLRAGNDPMVLNISSQLGSMEVAAGIGRDTPYCVSKAALNMWSVKAAADLRPAGVAVLMLHPGWVATDMGGPSARMTPAQSATAIVETVDGLGPDDSGRFINWDGSDHPW